MKKLLLVTALVLALAVPALAAPPSQMNYGCGLGAVVFKEGGANDSLLLQLVATFLNGLCAKRDVRHHLRDVRLRPAGEDRQQRPPERVRLQEPRRPRPRHLGGERRDGDDGRRSPRRTGRIPSGVLPEPPVQLFGDLPRPDRRDRPRGRPRSRGSPPKADRRWPGPASRKGHASRGCVPFLFSCFVLLAAAVAFSHRSRGRRRVPCRTEGHGRIPSASPEDLTGGSCFTTGRGSRERAASSTIPASSSPRPGRPIRRRRLSPRSTGCSTTSPKPPPSAVSRPGTPGWRKRSRSTRPASRGRRRAPRWTTSCGPSTANPSRWSSRRDT